MRLLIQKGANSNAVNRSGFTALHLAANNGDIKSTEQQLNKYSRFALILYIFQIRSTLLKHYLRVPPIVISKTIAKKRQKILPLRRVFEEANIFISYSFDEIFFYRS